jgi:hypothetical protein
VDLADHVTEEDTQQIVLAEAVGMKARRLEVPLESGTLSIAARQVRLCQAILKRRYLTEGAEAANWQKSDGP